MLTAPALSTVVPASADHRETACRGQTAHLVEKGFRLMNGLLALGERPAGVVAVTAISALLSRISGSTQIGFGNYLRDLCDDLAAMSGRSGGPKLTCAAADATLPIGAAITLGLIADLLITNAFPSMLLLGRGGAAASPSQPGRRSLLTVEDGGIAMRARDSRRDNGLTIARLLVVRLGGRLRSR